MINIKPLFNLKAIFYYFFTILLTWIGYNLYQYIENAHGFILGDWLVNYHDGGFKRRGLSGSFFFIIQDLTGINLKTLVFSTQMVLYFLFFFLIGKILYKKTVSILFLSLILSPLTFLFYLNDPHIVGRKEILLYLIFAYFIYLKDQKKFKGYRQYLVYLFLFIGTLFHEIFIFYMPYFLLASYLFDGKIKIKENTLLFLSVLVPTFFIFFFGGLTNEGESLIMLSQRGIDFPSDKLNIFDFSNTLLSSLDRYKDAPISYSLYLVSLLLGIIHFSFYLRTESSSSFKKIIKYFMLAIIYSLPLFVLVCDWGRWLQIHFILLFLILLSRRPKHNESQDKALNIALNTKNIILLVIIIPFFFTWRIYHFKDGFNLDGILYFVFKKITALI